MHTLEFNKIAAAVLTAGVLAMLLGLVARILIPSHDTHGEGPNLFADLAPTAPTDSSEPAGPKPIAVFMADASVEDGEKVAKKCMACHTFEAGGATKVGPNLANVVGHERGTKDYAYSGAFQELGGTWTYEELNKFLYDPRNDVPGTKMSFVGLKKPEDRADVIAFLRSHTENPPPLPEPAAEGAEEAPKAEGAQEAPKAEGAQEQPNAEGAQEQPNAEGAQEQPNAEGTEKPPNAEGTEKPPNAEGAAQPAQQ